VIRHHARELAHVVRDPVEVDAAPLIVAKIGGGPRRAISASCSRSSMAQTSFS
jgi:hypothetical protein